MRRNTTKYRRGAGVDLPDRSWPGRIIERAPTWCSVDLRDGNQALIDPMDRERKHAMFALLVRLGLREIEVGFPSASAIEYDFVRELIEQGVPDDVTLQVLTPARPELIDETLRSIRGARRVVVHVYNSTSTVQRDVVFGMDRAGVQELAVDAVRRVRDFARASAETEVVLEYSPESFTQTELDFALEVCDAVGDVWEPTPEVPMIVNLPATVEVTTPDVFADRVEWMSRHLARRDAVVLSVHPHNDRGTAVAAAELAVMAGADRVEGTLLGNGERTGNVDLVTLAGNLESQGVPSGIDLSDVNEIVRVVEECNRLPVHPRHPYVGDLVFTAFSGSHQDAIRKALAARGPDPEAVWEVPYLPVDPADLGRSYEAVIRINSQSGKGGIAWVMEREHGLHLPRRLQVEFRQVVQRRADETARELSADELLGLFTTEYLEVRPDDAFELVEHQTLRGGARIGVEVEASVRHAGGVERVRGRGNGPIDAYAAALRDAFGFEIRLSDYREHGVGTGASATAAAYVELVGPEGEAVFGVGLHPDSAAASLCAVTSAANRVQRAVRRRSAA